MLQDAASDALVLDDREQSHRPLAPRTDEHVDRVRALHEDSPREPTLPAGIIGGHEVITPRMNRVVGGYEVSPRMNTDDLRRRHTCQGFLMKTPPLFRGRWRLVEMEMWDHDYLDLVVEAHITIEDECLGYFQFGVVEGQVDCRFDTDAGKPRATFVRPHRPRSVSLLVGALNIPNHER